MQERKILCSVLICGVISFTLSYDVRQITPEKYPLFLQVLSKNSSYLKLSATQLGEVYRCYCKLTSLGDLIINQTICQVGCLMSSISMVKTFFQYSSMKGTQWKGNSNRRATKHSKFSDILAFL